LNLMIPILIAVVIGSLAGLTVASATGPRV
jgi:hypothetical protein